MRVLHFRQGHGSTVNCIYRQGDPAQRRVDYLPMRFEPTPFDFIAESPTSNYSFSFQRPLSGDDGIRTRGLRLAKALLSR